MKFLIAILNNISDWLLYRLSDKIILKLWDKIENENGINCVVTYEYHNSLELQLNVLTDNKLSYEDELMVYECAGLINDLYPMISIQVTIYTKNEYEEVHCRRWYEVNEK